MKEEGFLGRRGEEGVWVQRSRFFGVERSWWGRGRFLGVVKRTVFGWRRGRFLGGEEDGFWVGKRMVFGREGGVMLDDHHVILVVSSH